MIDTRYKNSINSIKTYSGADAASNQKLKKQNPEKMNVRTLNNNTIKENHISEIICQTRRRHRKHRIWILACLKETSEIYIFKEMNLERNQTRKTKTKAPLICLKISQS